MDKPYEDFIEPRLVEGRPDPIGQSYVGKQIGSGIDNEEIV